MSDLTQHCGNDPDLRQIGLHPDFWYPFARSKRLKTGRTLAVNFAGEPIVLIRTESGRAFALEDRCAHRQMPLHLGVVDGERLQCSYHAWCYDACGKIVRVPYLPKGSTLPAGVRSYPCREAYGLIFVFPGDPTKAEQVPFPDVPTWASPEIRTMYFEREVRCHYSFMHENLLDMNHQFLHRRLMGSIKPVLLDLQTGEDWVEASYRFEQAGGKGSLAGDLLLGGVDPDPSSRDFDFITIRTQYPYQMLTMRRPSHEKTPLELWTAYVPSGSAQHMTHSFGLLMIRKPKIPGVLLLGWPLMRWFTERVFAQDRLAVEREQRAYDQQGGDWNQEVFPVILALRALLIRSGTRRLSERIPTPI